MPSTSSFAQVAHSLRCREPRTGTALVIASSFERTPMAASGSMKMRLRLATGDFGMGLGEFAERTREPWRSLVVDVAQQTADTSELGWKLCRWPSRKGLDPFPLVECIKKGREAPRSSAAGTAAEQFSVLRISSRRSCWCTCAGVSSMPSSFFNGVVQEILGRPGRCSSSGPRWWRMVCIEILAAVSRPLCSRYRSWLFDRPPLSLPRCLSLMKRLLPVFCFARRRGGAEAESGCACRVLRAEIRVQWLTLARLPAPSNGIDEFQLAWKSSTISE